MNTTDHRDHVLLFGASVAGMRAIEHYRMRGDVQVLGVVDNAKEKQGGTLLGVPVMAPADIRQHAFDRIIITSMHYHSIFNQLTREHGIPNEKITMLPANVQKGGLDFSDEHRRDLAREILLAVSGELTARGIPYHIDHGTLLGIYRDGDLLPWDNDVDLAIHQRDGRAAHTVLQEYAQKYRSPRCEHNAWCCTAKTGLFTFGDKPQERMKILKFENTAPCARSEALSLDVIIKHPHHGQLHWLASGTPLAADEQFLAGCIPLQYRGMALSVPRQTEAYLKKLFGNWQIPKKDWTHAQYENHAPDETHSARG